MSTRRISTRFLEKKNLVESDDLERPADFVYLRPGGWGGVRVRLLFLAFLTGRRRAISGHFCVHVTSLLAFRKKKNLLVFQNLIHLKLKKFSKNFVVCFSKFNSFKISTNFKKFQKIFFVGFQNLIHLKFQRISKNSKNFFLLVFKI